MDLRGDFVRHYPADAMTGAADSGLAAAVLPLAAARTLEALVRAEVWRHDADPALPLARALTVPPRVLLYGPAGCGKTHTAFALAAAMGCDLLEPVLREGPGLRAYLARDSRGRRCALLLDAVDTDARWLQESAVLAGVLAQPPVPIVLTARSLHAVPDVWRPHLDCTVHLPAPGPAEREALWSAALGPDLPLADDLNLAALAALPLTGAGIFAVVRQACRQLVATARPGSQHPDLLHQDALVASARTLAGLPDPPTHAPVLAPALAQRWQQLAGLGAGWQQLLTRGPAAAPVVLLDGPAGVGKHTVAQAIVAAWGLPVVVLQPGPTLAATLAAAEGREVALLLWRADSWPAQELQELAHALTGPGLGATAASHVPLILTARQYGSLPASLRQLVRERLTLEPPGPAERQRLWLQLAGTSPWQEPAAPQPPVSLALTGGHIAAAVDRARWRAAAQGQGLTADLLVEAAVQEAEVAGLAVRVAVAEVAQPVTGVTL
jgi:tRNA A37 threonylcarbamoyladenosine biosynthesis protein TsaE